MEKNNRYIAAAGKEEDGEESKVSGRGREEIQIQLVLSLSRRAR